MRLRVARVVAVTLALAVVVASLVACGDSDDATGGGTPSATVEVRGETLSYNPESVTIDPGQTVRWTWTASGHSVTSVPMVGGIPGCTPDGAFTSGILASGATFDHTFTTSGTYGYACTAAGHCAGFESGVVVVR